MVSLAKVARELLCRTSWTNCSPSETLEYFFFSRTFLPQDLGLGLLYWAVSRQRQRNDCCTGQSPGNEVIVLVVSLQARGEGVAKSKPCSLRGGWGSARAVGSRGMWARNSLGGGRKPSTLLWDDVSSHNKLAWHE